MNYSPQKIQQMLNLPPSTLRKYATLYSDHLSESAHRKSRKYTVADLAVLKRILALRDAGVPLDEISARLNVTEDPNPPEENLTTTITTLERLQSQSDQIAKIALLAADHQKTVDALIRRIEVLENQSFWDRLFSRKKSHPSSS